MTASQVLDEQQRQLDVWAREDAERAARNAEILGTGFTGYPATL